VPLSVSPRHTRRGSLAVALLVVFGLVIPAGVFAARPPLPDPVDIQILNVSDWHGNVDPLSPPGIGLVGGAWNLAARFAADRAAFDGPTLTLTAGDDIGGTPALVTLFQDEPSILAQRMMGIQVGTFGNHNFDKATTELQGKIDLAMTPAGGSVPGNPYSYVAANLKNLSANLTGVDPIKYFNLGGAKVAVIGIVNEEAPTLVFPGNFGTIVPTDGVAAANKFARIARKAGANAVLVITHKGVRGFVGDDPTMPFGELIDFTNALEPGLVDVVFGDHTDIQYKGTHNGVLVHENRSFGVSYAKTLLTVQPGRGGGVTAKSIDFVTPSAVALADPPANSLCAATGFCDQDVVDMLTPYRVLAAPIFNTVKGASTKAVTRFDQCGQSASRLCESLVGNVVTDALRSTYGSQIALTNSGGLRASLTCIIGATDPNGSDWCPSTLYPIPNGLGQYPITRGQILDTLAFTNVSATLMVNGAELKAMLERGVSAMPGADGRFPQISGFCFDYDIAASVNSRVTGAYWLNPDGSCNRASALDLTSSTTYTMTTNNFTASGGDGYPNYAARMATFDIMDVDVTEWIEANTPINPFVLAAPDGRINCTDGNGTLTVPNCPALTASPPVT
jgi:2',3'-cyclic-nucleotide 2'-phosphodiesterase (5'-nucleotidase family)